MWDILEDFHEGTIDVKNNKDKNQDLMKKLVVLKPIKKLQIQKTLFMIEEIFQIKKNSLSEPRNNRFNFK